MKRGCVVGVRRRRPRGEVAPIEPATVQENERIDSFVMQRREPQREGSAPRVSDEREAAFGQRPERRRYRARVPVVYGWSAMSGQRQGDDVPRRKRTRECRGVTPIDGEPVQEEE